MKLLSCRKVNQGGESSFHVACGNAGEPVDSARPSHVARRLAAPFRRGTSFVTVPVGSQDRGSRAARIGFTAEASPTSRSGQIAIITHGSPTLRLTRKESMKLGAPSFLR